MLALCARTRAHCYRLQSHAAHFLRQKVRAHLHIAAVLHASQARLIVHSEEHGLWQNLDTVSVLLKRVWPRVLAASQGPDHAGQRAGGRVHGPTLTGVALQRQPHRFQYARGSTFFSRVRHESCPPGLGHRHGHQGRLQSTPLARTLQQVQRFVQETSRSPTAVVEQHQQQSTTQSKQILHADANFWLLLCGRVGVGHRRKMQMQRSCV